MFETAAEPLLAGPGISPGWSGPLRWSIDEDGQESAELLWDLVGDRVGVAADATPAEERFAWESAAGWTQDRLDELEITARTAHVELSEGLLLAYRSSMRDAAVRFGAGQGQRGSKAARLFFRQTALRLGMRPGQVSRRVDSLERLAGSMPATRAAYRTKAASWQAVDLAVSIAEGLTGEQVAAYDGPAAEAARTVFENRSVTVDHGLDGEGSLTLTGPIVDIVAMESAVRLGAIAAHGAEDEARTIGQLQYDVVKDLILEGAKLAADPASTTATVRHRKGVVPKVTVTVPVLTLLGRTEEPARLEGYGPIDAETARRLAAGATSFHRLLTHPVTGVRLTLDRTTYKPPADLRLWVQLRDDVCRFPGCERPASECDIDHAHEWRDPRVTDAINLVSLCRADHDGKTTGLVTECIRPDDTVDWETLWGKVLTDPPPEPFDPVPDDLIDEIVEKPADPDDCPFWHEPDPPGATTPT